MLLADRDLFVQLIELECERTLKPCASVSSKWRHCLHFVSFVLVVCHFQ